MVNKKNNILDFQKSKKRKVSHDNEPSSDDVFDGLAEKLSDKLNTIEKDLKEGLGSLEDEVKKTLSQNHADYSNLKKDMQSLAKFLEGRMQTSLDNLLKSRDKPKDKSELDLVQSLTQSLSQFFSADFFMGMFDSTQTDDASDMEVDAFGMSQKFREKLKPFFDFLYYKYWRLQVTGIHNIPNDGRALIVGNHSGALPYDGTMVGMTIWNEHPVRNDVRFLVENFVYYMPFLGSTMYRLGGVRACPQNAERLLETGHLLVVFPEGVKGLGKYYKDRYRLQRFGRGGFIRLCIKTKSPLIPVGIVGAEEIHPVIYKSNTLAKIVGSPYIPITPTFPLLGLFGLIPLPSKWSIHYGEAIDFQNYTSDILDDGITIHKLSEEVRDKIQNILFELLKKRRSIWA